MLEVVVTGELINLNARLAGMYCSTKTEPEIAAPETTAFTMAVLEAVLLKVNSSLVYSVPSVSVRAFKITVESSKEIPSSLFEFRLFKIFSPFKY